MDHARWALDQVLGLHPTATTRAWPSVQSLVGALTTIRRPKEGAQIFGLEAAHVPDEARPALEAAILEVLVAWRREHESKNDVRALLDLARLTRALDVAELRLDRRYPLRCDPLGAREGLSPEWRARLERLDDVVAGRSVLDPQAVRVPRGTAPHRVAFGAPDEGALYEHALRHEVGAAAPFSRELAAFWTTANGIVIDDAAVLAPVADWRDEDRGLRIGSGSDAQGSLTIGVTRKAGLVAAKVFDRDDDGVVLARYANVGAFLDALLFAKVERRARR